jgi:hypothetical protein
VELLADSVPDELAHHRKPVHLDPRLHGVPMSDSRPPTRTCAIARSSDFARHLQQLAPRLRNPSHRHRHRRVAVEPVELDADVERDDVASTSFRVGDGIPCTTSSFTDVHSVAGNPR